MLSVTGQAVQQPNAADGREPYHWFNMPDGEIVRGFWDLRNSWRDYLGRYDFAGKTVLELGPASGFLTVQMEYAGARVTAFEVAEGCSNDLLPVPGLDMDELARVQALNIDRFKKNWRFYQGAFELDSEVIYGDIYNLPTMRQKFDVTTFAAILLHLSNPFRAIQEAAKVTEKTIIVTDIQNPAVGDNAFIEFNPNPASRDGAGWWLLSHAAISRMLATVGFTSQRLSFSTHRMHRSPTSDGYADLPFFTIVASR
jgi:O-methyltransferase